MSGNVSMYNSNNLNQQLNLAPQLLNWLKILQASRLDLTQMIHEELASNPALEEGSSDSDSVMDDWSSDEMPLDSSEMYLDGSDVGTRLSVLADIDEEWRSADDQPLASSQVLQEKHDFMIDHLVKASSLRDELEDMILFSDLDGIEARIAGIIAGSIDDRGYLDARVEDIALMTDSAVETVERVLDVFQQMAPAGIAARDLRECLLLQLKAMDADTGLAEELAGNWLENLAMKQHKALADHLGVSLDALNEAFDLIRTLDPEPGRSYSSAPVEYVEADMEIFMKSGELQVELLDARLPRLQLSSYCKMLLEARKGSKEDLHFIRMKVREANFLIQGISQRQDTMLKVAHEIMRVQRSFLTTKDGRMQPLTMNKVASMIGVHETTVSRAIANKYIRTQRGLIEMRAFFKVGYRCADGSSVAPERVREMVAELIHDEDPLKPLIDSTISDHFKKMGLKVARRTVAKYREELDIPSSKERLASARRRKNMKLAMAV
ncbi:MAG: RNA polymerase factor sigma-54 [Pontiellaceae bacterium]|nr:RNA polymerase factor sigma-54 [Pontiellaceae bacterium]MBN2784136.1 RNA polymerase factor sigma-54 [Pontiellaceae bacterium]